MAIIVLYSSWGRLSCQTATRYRL